MRRRLAAMARDYRSQFEIPRDVCYLNAAYMGIQPRVVVEAAMHGARRRSQPWSITPRDFFLDVEALRTAVASHLGCASDYIAIVPSATYGIATAAANLNLEANDVILTLQGQFPSNYYAWRRKCLDVGCEIVVVDREAGQTWADAVLEAVRRYGERISIATLEGHHWASGDIIDLALLIPALRKVGARVVLDLTQTVGAATVDIARLAPDFMVAAGYKWQFAPYGVAFLYVNEDQFGGVPIEEGWINRDGAEDFSRLSEFTDHYQVGARRFDMSEKSSFSNIAGALAAQKVLAEWGIENISATLLATNARIASILDNYGFETVDPKSRAPHFQGARLPDTDSRQLAERLLERRVFASVRGKHLRVAPHLYTDDEDLQRFDRALAAALS